ncbi:MAG: hypothetical protein JWQ40_1402 [Segetibacter sp.]|nr:hypothetical protein [Segetibacter sp.]
MKKVTGFLLIFLPLCGFSQMINDSTYKATNGITFTSGQQVKIGLGSRDDGSFKYIEPVTLRGEKVSSDFAAQPVRIWSVRKLKSKETDVVYGFFTTNKNVYRIKIDAALLAKELQ